MPEKPSARVVIIGGGLGGLMSAIKLKRKFGHDVDFTIYEKWDDIGGTWKANTYPGAASDVETHWYSLSTDPNPDFPVTHVPQAEIHAYWKSLARKYDLYPNIHCNTKVLSADWDEKKQVYAVKVQDVKTKETREDYANIIISAVGLFSIPRYPENLKGLDRFKGDHFHSGEWDHNVSLHQKRVAVIGNACSAAQFLPEILKDPTTEVMNFCRSPNWVLAGMPHLTFTPLRKWIFRHVPFALKLYRFSIFLMHDLFYEKYMNVNEERSKKIVKAVTRRMKKLTPEKYHDLVIPKYTFGCKRIVFGTGYLDSLHKPNMDVTYDGVQEYVEDGIITEKGEKMNFDVIIFATGFNTYDYPIPIRGRTGYTVQEYHDQKGGPQSYYGTALPGFPNFYILAGPNASATHGSVVFSEEVQLGWAMQLIKPIVKGQVSSFEPTEEATEAHNKIIQLKLQKTIWATGCTSWYRRPDSKKIYTLFPGSHTAFMWAMRKPVFEDFRIVNGNGWMWRRKLVKIMRLVLAVTNVFILVFFGRRQLFL
ncbi:FAD-binding Monooxygenase Superfamily protein [Abortiporus biennis]